MTSPSTSRKLLHCLRKVAETLPEREVRIGKLRFDAVNRILHKGRTWSRLRPKEAALLTYRPGYRQTASTAAGAATPTGGG